MCRWNMILLVIGTTGTTDMTKSTARYFAKEAYRLAMMRGIFQSNHGDIRCLVGDGFVLVTDRATGKQVEIKIAASWL